MRMPTPPTSPRSHPAATSPHIADTRHAYARRRAMAYVKSDAPGAAGFSPLDRALSDSSRTVSSSCCLEKDAGAGARGWRLDGHVEHVMPAAVAALPVERLHGLAADLVRRTDGFDDVLFSHGVIVREAGAERNRRESYKRLFGR